MNTSLKLLALGFIVLAGCSSQPTNVAHIPEDANPDEQIALLDKDLSTGREKQVDALSPQWFHKSEVSLQDAKKLRSQEGKNVEVLAKVEEGKSQLQEANKYSQIASEILTPVIAERSKALAMREEAQSSGAKDRDAEKRFNAANDQFLKLTQAIENDKMKYAESRKGEVIDMFQKAQASASKARALDVAKQTIETAKDQGASSYAPKALDTAEQSVKSAETFANNNPTVTDEIMKRGTVALFNAKRALNLAKESKKMDEMKPEERANFLETQIGRLSKTMGLEDQRDSSFDQQFAQLDQSIQTTKTSAQGRELLTAEVNRTAASAQMDQKFGEIQSIFAKSEADVYRQGDKILVRLKAIKFPSGKAQITKDNYAVLNKVQKAIAKFGDSSVLVEGNTDSLGTAKLNNKISLERADAVKEYLVQNDAVPADQITAIGHGFSKPLTDNKTAAGRAANRRIDVVIAPVGGIDTQAAAE